MSRASICIKCQFEAFAQSWQPQSTLLASRGQRRFLATALRQRVRRAPSRMILSDNVAKTREQLLLDARRKKSHPGPFGGMNRTEAKFTGRHNERSAAEIKRSGGGQETADGKDKKKERGTFHALKMQSTLTPISYMQRDSTKTKLENIKTFEEFDLLPDVGEAIYSQALPGLIEVGPTPAQKLLIPAMLESTLRKKSRKQPRDGTPQYDQFLIAAETGSGKTLAYTLPVIDAVKRLEVVEEVEAAEQRVRKEEELRRTNELDPFEDEPQVHRTTGRPKAMILVPSAELVSQIGKFLKQMAHKTKFRSAAISAKHTPKYIANNLFNRNGVDIVVTTPHLMSSIARTEPNVFSRVSHLIVDEADSLLDRSFAKSTLEIIDKVSPSLKQLVFCSATIPKSLNSLIDQRFPMMKRLVTPKLHSIPRRVQLGVIDVDKGGLYRNNKDIACADIIWSMGKGLHEDKEAHNPIKLMMVFVNERETAEEVAKFLQTKGIDASALTRDTSEERQSELLEKFTASTRQEGTRKVTSNYVPFEEVRSGESTKPMKKLPDVKVLVTTDLGSRGIDTLAVRHVILYDVPHNTIDFIHRLGRVGRMGRRGRAIILVGKTDRKDIVREVQDGMFKGQALI